MLDKDLAELYQVEVRVLNQSVKRNIKRFPPDFMFQLSEDEWGNLKSQFVTSSWGGTRKLPFAFTEQGLAMLSGILNSDIAISVNISIMRAFVAIRKALPQVNTNKELEELKQRVKELEESSEDTLSAINDLSEDTRRELDDIYLALTELAEKKKKNKLHYAAHGHTAAEVIYQRADAQKPFMGLTSFSGELPALKDIGIAKNYLDESELKVLNNLVSGYFDLAEINAIEHKPMYMDDYVKQLDSVLSSGNRKLLTGSGSVSHKQALEKAKSEYRKYQEITLTPVEKAYLESIKEFSKEVKRR